jgi:hypothetical protein
MYDLYSQFSIILYSDKLHQSQAKWAKTFYLMQSAHPIQIIQTQEFSSFTTLDDKNITLWLKQYLPQLPNNFKGLIAPVSVRPLLEIDFLDQIEKENKFAITLNNLPIFCIHDINNSVYKKVDIDGVFEDLSSVDGKKRIQKEMDYMQNILKMGLS